MRAHHEKCPVSYRRRQPATIAAGRIREVSSGVSWSEATTRVLRQIDRSLRRRLAVLGVHGSSV